MAHWGVVGGGLLGMTLAHRLGQAGHRVTLLEATPSLGGLASAWSIGDVVWDRHYHVILLSDSHLRALLDEIGLTGELRWSPAKTSFYSAGRLHPLSNVLEFLRFPPLRPWERLRLAATIFRASRIRDWRPLERELCADWLERWSGRSTCEKIWIPLLRAKLGEAYQQTSAAFIWATIARMYAARRTGLKQELFGYVRGGYARILERFSDVLRRAGIELELETPTRSVVRAADGRLEIDCEGRERRCFDRVLLTVPAPVALRICPGLSPDEARRLGEIRYVGIVCASLLLERPLSPYYITNITDDGIPFTAVIEMSALVDREQFGGRALVYLPRYAIPGEPVFSRSDPEIRDEFVGALRRMHPGLAPQDVAAFRVSRVPGVFALPTLGYSARLPPTTSSIPGLHIVNSAHIVNGTLNVNEVLRLAEQTLPSLLDPRPEPAATHARYAMPA
jgi:protoporphyrinogen oxidase